MTTWILLPIRYSLCLSPGKHKTTVTYTTVCSVQEMFMVDHCPGTILMLCLCRRKIPFPPVQTFLSGLSKRTVWICVIQLFMIIAVRACNSSNNELR